MNEKRFGLSRVLVLLAVLVLGAGYVQAQTPGQIPVFIDAAGNLADSVVTQDAGGRIGIGTTNPAFGSLQISQSGAAPALTIDGSNFPSNNYHLVLVAFSPDSGIVNYKFVTKREDQGLSTDVLTLTQPTIPFGEGKVGVGTTNPAFGRLQISQSGAPAALTIDGSNFPPNNYHLDLVAFSPGSGIVNYKFVTKREDQGLSTTVLTLTQPTIPFGEGKVGIGTDAPRAKLHVVGDFIATGTKSALVETASYGDRHLYAVESPENWFEDFGGARLNKGRAVVKLDPIFAETVSTDIEYHVFLTPRGNCRGLYVANQTPTSFEVRELQKGTGNIAFDYRIVAKRKGYEKARLAKLEHTNPETLVAEVTK